MAGKSSFCRFNWTSLQTYNYIQYGKWSATSLGWSKQWNEECCLFLLHIMQKKRVSEISSTQRHASAPSLVSSSFELSQQPSPLSTEAKPWKLPEVEPVHNPSEARHRKLVVLQDSPLTQKKSVGKSRTAVSSHSGPLHPTPPSVNPPKQTMIVQWSCYDLAIILLSTYIHVCYLDTVYT